MKIIDAAEEYRFVISDILRNYSNATYKYQNIESKLTVSIDK